MSLIPFAPFCLSLASLRRQPAGLKYRKARVKCQMFGRAPSLPPRSDDAGSLGAFSSLVDGGDVEFCYRFGAWL